MIQIKINNVDKASLIDWRSIRLKSALTNQIDTLEFEIKRYGSKNYKPSFLDDVELIEGSATLFAGKIIETEEFVKGANIETFRVLAKDHSYEMDRKLVVNVYENQTIDAIITDIKNNFLPPGFTVSNVNAPINISYVRFNYEQPSKCFQQLAELVGYDWFVDINKDVNFFSKETSVAPFSLTDTGGKYIYNSLRIKRNVVNLRNTIFVRGGTFRGTLFVEEQEADGDTKVFIQGFKYSNIVVKKNGSPLTVGIDWIDDPATKDVLYNFNEKAVKFRDDNKPVVTDIVRVEGLPHIPVIIKSKDNSSVSEFGEFEHKIIDKSLNSKGGARDRAKAEVLQWAAKINEGSFITHESGLEVGQKILIQSDKRNINESFVISRITTKMDTPNDLIHNVVLMSTQTFGAVEFLQKLLIQKDKDIEILEDEVLDKIETAFETIVLSEEVVVLTSHNPQTESLTLAEVFTPLKDAGTIFVYAPFAPPSGLLRQGHYDSAVFS